MERESYRQRNKEAKKVVAKAKCKAHGDFHEAPERVRKDIQTCKKQGTKAQRIYHAPYRSRVKIERS